MNEKVEYNINVNKGYFTPGIEKLNNNNYRNRNIRKILIGNKNGSIHFSNTLPNGYFNNK